MRWVVEAVDSRTGLDTEMTVEALTAADAERIARYNGLLVADVYKHVIGRRFRLHPPPVVAYAPPKVVERGLPTYAQVLRDAAWVRKLGQAVLAVGWVGVFGAVAWFAYLSTRSGADNWANWRAWLVAPAADSWRWALAGASCVVLGSMLRLLGAAALCVRDIARNTCARDAFPDGGEAEESIA